MELSTIFLAIIAISSAIIALSFLVIAIVVYKLSKSIDDKLSILTYESATILKNIKSFTNITSSVSKAFNIFSFFKKGNKNETK